MPVVLLVAFGVAWWLGLYLLARDPRKPVLRRAGTGLLCYALALAAEHLGGGPVLDDVRLILLCLPALAWTGVLVLLLPEDLAVRLSRWWWRGAVPLFALAAVVPLAFAGGWLALGPVAVAPLGLGAALCLVVRHRTRLRPDGISGPIWIATLLFGLGVVLPLLRLDAIPSWPLLAGIGLDLVLLGVCVAVYDAFEEGEALRGDMLRSLLISLGVAVLFGAQVAVAILVTGPRPALTLLLYGTVAAAIAVQVLANPIQSLIDRLAFRAAPELRRERAELREVADALPRRAGARLAELDEGEFTRLTRRALSHYGDLGKLVSSPLVELPAIDARLRARGVPDAPLERAIELKALLLETISRLKPADGDFGTSEEWRHYNSLYFYYVVGIRPYSVRTKRTDLDPVARRALAWFVDQVPERTLHNWQNVAAKLVATELRAGLPVPTNRG